MSGISMNISIDFSMEEAARMLSPNQLQALFRGLAQIIAARPPENGTAAANQTSPEATTNE